MSKDKKSGIEIQYESCKVCNGTGRNYWLGPQPPRLSERLCSECWGVGKRPIQYTPPTQAMSPVSLDIAQAEPMPQAQTEAIEAQEKPLLLDAVVQAAIDLGDRELTPEDVQKLLEPKPHGPIGSYRDYDEIDPDGPCISGGGYCEDTTPDAGKVKP